MGKRKSKREAVRTITGGKPHHEERTFDLYPIRCEVEPWTAADADATGDGTSTTDGEATAPTVDLSSALDSADDGWRDGYGNPF